MRAAGYDKGINGTSAMTLLLASGMLCNVGCGNQRLAEEVGSQEHDYRPDAAASTENPRDAGAGSSSGSATSMPTESRADVVSPVGETSPHEAPSAGDGGASFTTDASTTNLAIEGEAWSFVDGECPDDQWCWVTPLPIGERFAAISGTSDGRTVFAVGRDGACVQFDRETNTWTVHRSTERGDLFDVEVESATRVWAAGADGVYHYDGVNWERQLAGYSTSIVKGAAGDLWAVSGNQLFAYDNDEWQVVVPTIDGEPALATTGGVSQVVVSERADEFWVLTYQSVTRLYHELEVIHFHDGSFTKLDGSYTESVSPGLVRYQGAVYFADGSRRFDVAQGWVEVDALPEHVLELDERTLTVAGTSLSSTPNVDDTPSREVPTTTALWGAKADDVWIAAGGGGIVRMNYLTGETVDSSSIDSPWHTTNGSEWSASESDAWRGPELEHFDGVAWTRVTTDDGAPYVERITGSGPDNVWFVGAINTGVWRWDGEAVRAVPQPESASYVSRVYTFDTETWAGAVRDENALVVRYEGDGWSDVHAWPFEPSQPNSVVDIAGVSPSNAYVALRDRVEHFDGETWRPVFQAPDGEGFTAMAVDGERLWVLGANFIYHRDKNGEWSAQWYGFQTMNWIGFAEGAVWLMGGWLGSGVLRSVQ